MYFRSLSLNHRSCVRFPESILHLSFAVHSSHQLCSPVAVWVKSMSSFCFACENQKTSRSKPSHTASRIQSSTHRITSCSASRHLQTSRTKSSILPHLHSYSEPPEL